MTTRSALRSLTLAVAICVGAFAAPAPTHAQSKTQPEGCNARARVPWTAAGDGYFAEAIVSGPSCAQAVVVFVPRRPGGLAGRLDDQRTVLPGSAPMSLDVQPTTEVPALAGVRDAAAMTAALPGWLAERLRGLDAPTPKDREDEAARRVAGETRGDCGARVTTPWPGAGAGYAIEVFADGTDCNNALLAMVVRAPDGKPLYSYAEAAVGYTRYHSAEITTKGEMEAALRQWIRPDNETTEGLVPWLADRAEGEYVSSPGGTTHMIDTGKTFTRETYNELAAAKRPMFSFRVSEHFIYDVVLMRDGRVIKAAAIWVNY